MLFQIPLSFRVRVMLLQGVVCWPFNTKNYYVLLILFKYFRWHMFSNRS